MALKIVRGKRAAASTEVGCMAEEIGEEVSGSGLPKETAAPGSVSSGVVGGGG